MRDARRVSLPSLRNALWCDRRCGVWCVVLYSTAALAQAAPPPPAAPAAATAPPAVTKPVLPAGAPGAALSVPAHTFEVASVRPANRDDGRQWFGEQIQPSGRFTVSAMTLESLVRAAYLGGRKNAKGDGWAQVGRH